MFKKLNKIIFVVVSLMLILSTLTGCGIEKVKEGETRVIVDQLGREVEIPVNIEKVAALHHYSGKLMYALGLKDKLIHKALYHTEGEAFTKMDKEFAALPDVMEGKKQMNTEGVVELGPEIVFVYASFGSDEIEQFEQAGLTAIGIKGETLEEAYETIALFGEIFNVQDKAQEYTEYVKDKYNYLNDKTKELDEDKKPKVLITGPKNIYTVATGEMLQNEMIELGGGINLAKDIKGRWTEVSPEQIVAWNPDYLFLGSSFDDGDKEEIYNDPAFATVAAVRNKQVYIFPSNIGWWDYPLPHAVLGMLWTADKINPELFEDMDVKKIADEYYKDYLMGYTFTELGGKLD